MALSRDLSGKPVWVHCDISISDHEPGRDVPMPKLSYIVIRTWRKRRRVLFISEDKQLATVAYDETRNALRDGDVALVEIAELKTVKSASGGYNRTRW